LFCHLSFLTVSNAQTRDNKNQHLTYDDADGYQVLSGIIDARANKLKSESVSIFHQTVSGESVRDVRTQCAGGIPAEFQGAAEDFDKKATTRFLLTERFSLEKKYRFVVGPTSNSLGVFSVSAVGFDKTKTRAIVLVEYLVHPTNSIVGGDTTFYLLRKTEEGWKEATEIPKCGRVY
jgi:hypothetical protein